MQRRELLILHRVEDQLETLLVVDLVCVVAHLVRDLPPVGRFDSGQERGHRCKSTAHGDEDVHDTDTDLNGNIAVQHPRQHCYSLFRKCEWQLWRESKPVGVITDCDNLLKLCSGKLEAEIAREPLQVALDGLIETTCLNLIKVCQIRREHDLDTANREDARAYDVGTCLFNDCQISHWHSTCGGETIRSRRHCTFLHNLYPLPAGFVPTRERISVILDRIVSKLSRDIFPLEGSVPSAASAGGSQLVAPA